MKTIQDLIDRINAGNIHVGTMFSLTDSFKGWCIDYLTRKCRKRVNGQYSNVSPTEMPLYKIPAQIIIDGVKHNGFCLWANEMLSEISLHSEMDGELYKIILVGDDVYVAKYCSSINYDQLEDLHEYLNAPIPVHTVTLKTPSKKMVFANVLAGEWDEPKNKHATCMSVGNIMGNRNLRDWMSANTSVGTAKTSNCSIYLWQNEKGIIGTQHNPLLYDWDKPSKYPVYGVEEDKKMQGLNQFLIQNGYVLFGSIGCGAWHLEFTDLDNYKANGGSESLKGKSASGFVDGHEYIETGIPASEIEYQCYWGEIESHQFENIAFEIRFK